MPLLRIFAARNSHVKVPSLAIVSENLGEVSPMPALFPIFAIFAVFVFISTHAAVTPSKKKKPKEPSDLEKAAKEIAKALKGSESKDK